MSIFRQTSMISRSADREVMTPTSSDLAVVCVWALLGLNLTACVFALGYGAEIAQILALAGNL